VRPTGTLANILKMTCKRCSNFEQVFMTNVTVKQTAIIQFMSDRSVVVKLSGIDGVTAKMLDTSQTMLEHKVNELRSKIRIESTVALHRLADEEKAKVVASRRDAQQGDL
jgi:hypothetical protein